MDWKEEFNKKFINRRVTLEIGSYIRFTNEIKQFISDLLKERDKEILEKINNLGKNRKISFGCETEAELVFSNVNAGYLQALEDIKNLIK